MKRFEIPNGYKKETKNKQTPKFNSQRHFNIVEISKKDLRSAPKLNRESPWHMEKWKKWKRRQMNS